MNAWNSSRNPHQPLLSRLALTLPALILALFTSVSLSAQTAKPEKESTYTIRGTVLNSVTHAPVGRALVFTADNQFAKLTDDQGHFEFKVPRPVAEQPPESPNRVVSSFSFGGRQTQFVTSGITLGPFMARKPGYLEIQYPNPPMDLETAASTEIKITLVPESFIIGRVNLPVTDGFERIQVEICRREIQEGRTRWNPAGTTSTKANGEFRFANLREGEYKLFTLELLDRDPLTFDPRGQLFGSPPVYYPASEDFESAAIISLKAGETFSATLTPSRREYYPVKLGVLNATLTRGYNISVERQGHRGPGYSLGFDQNENTIVGILPNGNYTVELTQYGEQAFSGMLNFSVSGAPVQSQGMVLVPNSFIEVRVNDQRTRSEDAPSRNLRNSLNMMNVVLLPRDEFAPTNAARLQPPKSQEDESLAFGNVLPGSYWFRAGCSQSDYISEINSGGRDLLRQPLDVGFGSAVSPIEITLRDDGARLEGKIENWEQHAEGQYFVRNAFRSSLQRNPAQVVLLPVAENASPSRQFCQTWVTPSGDFSFPQVPPGEYRAMIFDRIPEDLEDASPESKRKYAEKGQVVRLVAGQHEHIQLTLDTGSE